MKTNLTPDGDDTILEPGDNLDKQLDSLLKDLIIASNGGYWYSYSEKVEIKELAEAKAQLKQLIAEQVVEGQIYVNEGYLQLFLGLQEHAIKPAFEEFASQLVGHAKARKDELELQLKDKQGE